MKPSETIQGSYSLVTMPDGSKVLMSKQSDGTWKTVDERLREQAEFESRFEKTDTVPANWEPATEIQALIKSKKISTKEHLLGHLIEVFGTPTAILDKGIDKDKMAMLNRNTAERDTLLVIIKSINDPHWNEVAKIIKQQSC